MVPNGVDFPFLFCMYNMDPDIHSSSQYSFLHTCLTEHDATDKALLLQKNMHCQNPLFPHLHVILSLQLCYTARHADTLDALSSCYKPQRQN